jgi:hypothetical protein
MRFVNSAKISPMLTRFAVVTLLIPSATRAGDVSEGFKYLPADTKLVLVIRMGELLRTRVFNQLRDEIHECDNGFFEESGQLFGISADDLDTMLLASNLDGQGVVVFRLYKPLKLSMVPGDLNAFFVEGQAKKERTRVTRTFVGPWTIFVPNKYPDRAFYLVDEKTMVFSYRGTLRAVLGRDKKPELSTELETGLRSTDFSAPVTLIASLQTTLRGTEGKINEYGVDVDAIRGNVVALIATLKFSDTADIRAVAVCKDAPGAKVVKKQLDILRATLAEPFSLVKNATKEVRDVPNNTRITQADKIVQADLSVSDELAIAFAKGLVIAMKPRLALPNEKP